MIAIRKLLSAVAAASLLATGSLAGAASLGGAQTLPTAAAQVDDPPAAVAGIPETGNLHVHKRIGAQGVRGDGQEVTDESALGAPAYGINYEVHLIQEVETLGQYKSAGNVTLQEALAQVEREESLGVTTGSTDEDGLARFDGLDSGLYLVVEEPNPVTTGENPMAVSPAAPFLVAVPLTNPENRTEWLKTVHVYPKGQAVTSESVSKQFANDEPAHVGDEIEYSISGVVPPALEEGDGGFSITDKLPAELGVPEIMTVTINGATAVNETDYKFRTWLLPEDDRHVLAVSLTETGLDTARADAGSVTVTFSAPVERTPGGTIDNRAWVSPVDLSGVAEGWDPEGEAGPNPGTESNTTRSIYGEISIAKTGQGDDADGLGGAVFELHRCNAAGDVVTADPIAIGGEGQENRTQRTTAGNGEALFSGIHLANVPNQGTLEGYADLWEGNGEQFCLVETQAPEGYELLPAPVIVPMAYTAGTTGLVVTDSEIQNVRANFGSQLPLTGGIGIWAILGIGVLLLLAAAAYYLANRKRDA